MELINCDYRLARTELLLTFLINAFIFNFCVSTKRFPFTYCWWSAYAYKRHLLGDNMPDADGMLLVNQDVSHSSCKHMCFPMYMLISQSQLVSQSVNQFIMFPYKIIIISMFMLTID